MEKLKLLCVPFAGGSSMVYAKWIKYLEPFIKVIPLEIAGRGTRSNEQLNEDMDQTVNDIFDVIKEEIEPNSNYALFGHSMGSWIVFEVAQRIKRENLQAPVHLFCSGKEAPQIVKGRLPLHNLNDEEFIKEIVKIGGIQEELIRFPEFSSYYAPIIRSDLKIVEEYEYKGNFSKLKSPITIFNGVQDDLNEEDLLAWEIHTDGEFMIENFQGGHFFIQEEMNSVLESIKANLITSIGMQVELYNS